VCGFEAFIKDKHIIGKVEEKKQAHKKYKEAVETGKRAFPFQNTFILFYCYVILFLFYFIMLFILLRV
jgi:Vault protein inter-alpha-trypsin domain